MSDTTKRDAVLWEFCRPCPVCDGDGEGVNHERMADEIVRQRQRADRAERILDALALAREAVVEAAAAAYTKCKAENEWLFTHHIGIAFALLAAVAAAEREVDA